jgi:hypothetical protein
MNHVLLLFESLCFYMKTQNSKTTSNTQIKKKTEQMEQQTIAAAAKTQKWFDYFKKLVQTQVEILTKNAVVKLVLDENKLKVLFLTWSDRLRSAGSSWGSDITDLMFGAVAPTVEKLTEMDDNQLVCFAAIRPPNYSDDIDVIKPTEFMIPKILDRYDMLHENVSVAYVLKNIGLFLADLPLSADWSDGIDHEVTQVASQLSILPVTKQQPAEVGIAAFSYQCKGGILLVGPNGETGFTLEQPSGSNPVVFRDQSNENYCAIQIAEETREDVKQAFSKPKQDQKEESVEEEAKRYQKVENRVIMIQIPIDRPLPRAVAQGANLFKDAGAIEREGRGKKKGFGALASAAVVVHEECAYKEESGMMLCSEAASEDEEEDEPVKFGLARVSRGRSLGPIATQDRLNDKMFRTKNARIRISQLFYAVHSTGDIEPEMLNQFISQMSWLRRSKGAQHGSLVTGEGSWNSKDNVPIKLPALPNTIVELFATFAQHPNGWSQNFALPDIGVQHPLLVGEVQAGGQRLLRHNDLCCVITHQVNHLVVQMQALQML